ncbi:MAG: rRNA adenine N-6-methyltransferase family protein [Candidatus Aenigmatarchaeota archaeon]
MAVQGFSKDPLRDQVFLEDVEILRKIVSLARLTKKDTVLEIGAGDGRLTEELSQKAGKVIAIEADERLRPVLEKRFVGVGSVQLFFGNALSVIKRVPSCEKIVSNPPYSISEPLMRMLFRQHFGEALLTLPSGFAERLSAAPGDPAYSKLSLFFHAFFDAKAILDVGRASWSPVPGTESVVMRITPKKPAGRRERMIRALALLDDKKLRNALREALAGMPGGSRRKAREEVLKAAVRQDLLGKRVSSMGLAEVLEVLEAFK